MRRAAAGLCALALVGGCAALRPAERGPSPEAQRAYAEALSTLASDRAEGLRRLRAFVDARPESPLADDAALRLSELALEEGREEDALQRLVWVVRRFPEGDQADAARLRLARLQRSRGHPEAAWRTARALRPERLGASERRSALALLAALAEETRRPVERVRWLARLRDAAPEEAGRRAADEAIEATLAGMRPEPLARAAEVLEGALAARAQLARAEALAGLGEREAAGEALERARELGLGEAGRERAELLEQELAGGPDPARLLARLPSWEAARRRRAADPDAARGTLGVVLPLTGPFAAYGEESLQGVLLAAGVYGGEPGAERPAVRVRVRDTGGTPEGAARAVEELASEPDVAAVLGPLLAPEAEAAALAAERERVPLLALARRSEIARRRPQVFRLGASPRLETTYLADYATRNLGLRRFAILYPKDRYGRRLRAVFWDAVAARGGEVVGIGSYDPEATDFAEPIRRLVGFALLSAEERGKLAERERLLDRAKRSGPERAAELRKEARELTGPEGEPLPPHVDFEALFIPDTHENVGLIAPHLAFHDVRGTRLLGPSAWNHPELVEIGGRHVDGAVFTAVFHAEGEREATRRFAGRFESTFGARPSYLAAQAYDAAQLVQVQLAAGREGREALLQGLRATEAHPGVTGVTGIARDGNAYRRPRLLGVESGRIVPVDPGGVPPPVPEPEPREEADGEGAGPARSR